MAKNKSGDKYIDTLIDLTENYRKAMESFVKKSEDATFNYPYNVQEMFADLAAKAMENPDSLYKKQLELYTNYAKIWGNVLGRYLGENKEPLYKGDPRDRRFKDAAWKENLAFDFIKQSYILTSGWVHELVENLEKDDPKTSKLVDFYTKQFIDAMSPSNFAYTNPEVIKEALDTKGQNLVKGFQNLIEDLENSKKFLQVKTVDSDYFKLGENIATTKGKVIYKNELMELIQYTPTCEQTHELPLLIIPAWINKYYIFDLSPDNSYVKWMLDRGYTVFIISWVNPDKDLANKTFDDYMLQGPLAALDAIEKATGQKQVTAMGYCLGGTLLTCTLAYMAEKNDTRIKAATFLTTLVDFSQAGDMSLFISEEQLQHLDEQMQKNGYLDGEEMALMFSLLRSNDLIWTFVVNNYLMGKEPFPFDILYWNSDSTRLPAATHSFYLCQTYLKNALIKPNAITLNKVKIDLSKIKIPTYMFATKEDHIAPWGSCYKSTGILKGKNRFVLGGSGHVSGVINHPRRNKYGYWTSDKQAKSDSTWLKGATEHKGSWWSDWDKWNAEFSDKKVKAPNPGDGKLKPLYDAPGKYVKIK